MMKLHENRRKFLKTAALAGAAASLPARLVPASQKSLLVFTKSSGFEHQVVKRVDGKPSILENTVTRPEQEARVPARMLEGRKDF
jgi:hypothetical protein